MSAYLERVTLTGADDSVDPYQLIELSREFPFVEWGILIGSHDGTQRFPKRDWISRLCSANDDVPHCVQLSLHICGARMRNIANGNPDIHDYLSGCETMFQRTQLNWHGEEQLPIVGSNVFYSFMFLQNDGWEPEVIFQLDGANDHLFVNAGRLYRVSGLFDCSHGAGVMPTSWPISRGDIRCGWAGGLGPDNVVEEFQKIQKKAIQPFWIDMETKLFNDKNEFDLTKCRSVLEQIEGYMVKEPS